MHLNARRLHEGLTELLKQHVTALGAIDAADIAEGKEEKVKMPSEVLSMLRYTYDPDLLYEEEVLVKDEYSEKSGLPERLKVINRYMYTENDTLVLKNYRIAF